MSLLRKISLDDHTNSITIVLSTMQCYDKLHLLELYIYGTPIIVVDALWNYHLTEIR